MQHLQKTKNSKAKTKSGFVVLFAVLISSIVMTISFGLLNIAVKEIILSSSGRESQFGFYAADAGAECALYWDIKGLLGDGVSVFPTSTNSTIPAPGTNILCNEQNIMNARTVGGVNFRAWDMSSAWDPESGLSTTAATTTFEMSIVPGKSCVKVQVSKFGNSTKIQSYGYNTCNFSDPKVIERGIKITY